MGKENTLLRSVALKSGELAEFYEICEKWKFGTMTMTSHCLLVIDGREVGQVMVDTGVKESPITRNILGLDIACRLLASVNLSETAALERLFHYGLFSGQRVSVDDVEGVIVGYCDQSIKWRKINKNGEPSKSVSTLYPDKATNTAPVVDYEAIKNLFLSADEAEIDNVLAAFNCDTTTDPFDEVLGVDLAFYSHDDRLCKKYGLYPRSTLDSELMEFFNVNGTDQTAFDESQIGDWIQSTRDDQLIVAVDYTRFANEVCD